MLQQVSDAEALIGQGNYLKGDYDNELLDLFRAAYVEATGGSEDATRSFPTAPSRAAESAWERSSSSTPTGIRSTRTPRSRKRWKPVAFRPISGRALLLDG